MSLFSIPLASTRRLLAATAIAGAAMTALGAVQPAAAQGNPYCYYPYYNPYYCRPYSPYYAYPSYYYAPSYYGGYGYGYAPFGVSIGWGWGGHRGWHGGWRR